MGHGEIMDIDGAVNDIGNNKAMLLKGHESEVELSLTVMLIHFEKKDNALQLSIHVSTVAFLPYVIIKFTPVVTDHDRHY